MLEKYQGSIIVDGQDGAGKGELVKELGKMIVRTGLDVHIISFPAYNFPIGKFIRQAQQDPDIRLTLEERLKLYALNRTEALGSILRVREDSRQPFVDIFDRCYSSNILTVAYWVTQNGKTLTDRATWILKIFAEVTTLDAAFIARLGISEAPIVVTLLQAEDAIDAIHQDSTRQDGCDLYETTQVQTLASDFYRDLSNAYPALVYTYSQVGEEGVRMTPAQQAQFIRDKIPRVLHVLGYGKGKNPGIVSNVIMDPSLTDRRDLYYMSRSFQMNCLFEQYNIYQDI